MNKNGDSTTRTDGRGGGDESKGSGTGCSNGGGGDDEDELEGKKIPYEYSQIHLGFDVARMSMSDKIFMSSILQRWTGQQDITLSNSKLQARYLVLYHAHLLTDESTLQIQESLERYDNFAVLMTTEFPMCSRLSEICQEIPVAGPDRLFQEFKEKWDKTAVEDCWLTFFRQTFERWSKASSFEIISDIREWIYVCLQRNLRWTDVISYWIEVVDENTCLGLDEKAQLWQFLSNIESSGGWYLIPSYRIPVFWEKVHSDFARLLREFRKNK